MDHSLFRNSLYNSIYKTISLLFPLIVSTYVSHRLKANGIGLIASAQNVVQYFVILASLGIPNYGIREIAKNNGDQNKRNMVFSELFILNLISSLVCIVVYYGLINFSNVSNGEIVLYSIVGLTLVLNIFNVDWVYQGIEEYRYIAIRSIVVKLLSIVLILLFIKSEENYKEYALISIIATAGNNIVNVIYLKRSGIKFEKKGLNIQRHLKAVGILFFTAVSIELYTLLDTTMIKHFCLPENVGFYSNSMKIVKMLITAITAIGGVLLPRLSNYIQSNKIVECEGIIHKIMDLLCFMFFPCVFFLVFGADLIIPSLFGESFFPAILTLRISSFLILALGFSNLFGTQILLAFNGEKRLMQCTITGAIINIFLNLLLIPRYNQNGAAVASVISELIVTIMSYIYVTKHIRVRISISNIITSFVGGMIIGIIIILSKRYIHNTIIALLMSGLFGFSLYIIIEYLFKNPALKMITEMLKRRDSKGEY